MSEDSSVASTRVYISYLGWIMYSIMTFCGVFRGSFRLERGAHNSLMKYWERILGAILVLFVGFVQLGTFTTKELWPTNSGSDDSWEILWGTTLALSAVMAFISLFFKQQCYRLWLHYALIAPPAFCFVCVSHLILHDRLNIFCAPLVVLVLCGIVFLAVPPRIFQITGHAAFMQQEKNEEHLLRFGLPINNVVLNNDTLREISNRASSCWISIIENLKNRLRNMPEAQIV